MSDLEEALSKATPIQLSEALCANPTFQKLQEALSHAVPLRAEGDEQRSTYIRLHLAEDMKSGDIRSVFNHLGDEPDWGSMFVEWIESRPGFTPECWFSILMLHAGLTPLSFEASGDA